MNYFFCSHHLLCQKLNTFFKDLVKKELLRIFSEICWIGVEPLREVLESVTSIQMSRNREVVENQVNKGISEKIV